MHIITKILIVGSNTRPLSKSLKELGYTVYATSFFDLLDQRDVVDKLIVPDEFSFFDMNLLIDLAMEYVNEVDYIICSNDIDVSRFPKSKIIGNYDVDAVNNKYKLYKKLHKDFLMPETFKLNDVHEAFEISDASDKRYIVKPIYGSGGVNIDWLNEDSVVDDSFILQEYIDGNSVSSSFLSYPSGDVDMITTSDQIIGSRRLNATSFLYCGNVTPLVNDSNKIYNISSKISRMYNLVGSNGIDFVMQDNKVYVIEVNPRIQGTFENIEKSFEFNLANAHINACNNNKVNIPSVKKFSVKLMPYSFKDAYYNLNDVSNVHDVSDENYLIKKSYPICTIITSDRILENAMIKSEMIQKRVYDSVVKKV
ncbi:MAG: hypothetical protein BZ137_08490 [Methanosphaera sp. rholeuAM130]|nr:MAG: hypothetical protein BZ137_08490 [Methanosphaera sp. rholeuAM130]